MREHLDQTSVLVTWKGEAAESLCAWQQRMLRFFALRRSAIEHLRMDADQADADDPMNGEAARVRSETHKEQRYLAQLMEALWVYNEENFTTVGGQAYPLRVSAEELIQAVVDMMAPELPLANAKLANLRLGDSACKGKLLLFVQEFRFWFRAASPFKPEVGYDAVRHAVMSQLPDEARKKALIFLGDRPTPGPLSEAERKVDDWRRLGLFLAECKALIDTLPAKDKALVSAVRDEMARVRAEEQKQPEVVAAALQQRSPTVGTRAVECFNCKGPHYLRDCPQALDRARVTANKAKATSQRHF